MGKRIVPPTTGQKEGSSPAIPKPPKGLSLADITVRHTIGNHTTTVRGPDLARLIDATRHLHDRDEESDFVDATSIAIELDGLAEVLLALAEDADAQRAALGYLSDQLRRLSNRVAATAPRSVNQQPDWYRVEVKR
jgi:hypothetical protein